jgi:SOS-response transcriptional repressor LexA
MTATNREQTETLAFIRRHITERGRAPFQHEICIHLGTKSRGFVHRMLGHMAEKGLIRWHKFAPGGIELPEVSAQHKVTLNSEISRLVSDYAEAEGVKVEIATNELLRQVLGAAA